MCEICRCNNTYKYDTMWLVRDARPLLPDYSLKNYGEVYALEDNKKKAAPETNEPSKTDEHDTKIAIYTFGIACLIWGILRLLFRYHPIRSIIYIIAGIGVIGWGYDETLWQRLFESIEAKGNAWLEKREQRNKRS